MEITGARRERERERERERVGRVRHKTARTTKPAISNPPIAF
jgi:hypothetical protein